jgi:hypothetical protein
MVRQKTVSASNIARRCSRIRRGAPEGTTHQFYVECSTHLVQRASRVEGGEVKVEVRANVVLLAIDPRSEDGEGKQCSKWGKNYFQAYDSEHIVLYSDSCGLNN